MPAVAGMDDGTFKKHANKRHVGTDFLDKFTEHDIAPTVLKAARNAHEYWHRSNPDAYDHDHYEES